MRRRVQPDRTNRNDIDLPLFAWARTQPEDRPPPRKGMSWQVRAIAQHAGISVTLAQLVVELMGLQSEHVS